MDAVRFTWAMSLGSDQSKNNFILGSGVADFKGTTRGVSLSTSTAVSVCREEESPQESLCTLSRTCRLDAPHGLPAPSPDGTGGGRQGRGASLRVRRVRGLPSLEINLNQRQTEGGDQGTGDNANHAKGL